MRIERLAVLASGSGSNLQALLDAADIPAKITLVLTDRPAYALERAKERGIESVCIDRRSFADKAEFNRSLFDKLVEARIDAVVLAGYLSILDARLVERFSGRIINVHPSLIPSFCGMGYYGLKVHQAVLDYGCKLTGATVHFVDAGADTGPIIFQRSVEVRENDTPESLQARVLQFEHELLPLAVKLLAEGRLKVEGRRVIIIE